MQKLHWGPVIAAAACGLTLSALPTNSAQGETSFPAAAAELAVAESGGELINAVLFLGLVIAMVGLSYLSKRKG